MTFGMPGLHPLPGMEVHNGEAVPRVRRRLSVRERCGRELQPAGEGEEPLWAGIAELTCRGRALARGETVPDGSGVVRGALRAVP